MELFSGIKNSFEKINLPEAELYFCKNFWSENLADDFLKILIAELIWEQGFIKIFGKNMAEPRLTAWYGDAGKSYTYSGVKREPFDWHPLLLKIKTDLEKAIPDLKLRFNSVLCNFYRDGSDSMGFHADNEKELGQNPIIASVNLGETRKFLLKHRTHKNLKTEILLTHGSVLIMAGEMQHHWLHAIPKSTKNYGARINLTFRDIKN